MEAFGTDMEWFLGKPSRLWVTVFPADRAMAIRIAAAVAELVLPEWRTARADDTAPLRAVKAALSDPGGRDDGLRQHARALAKACSESRRRSLGCGHRIAEAARALANAAAASTDAVAMDAVGEALAKVEEHLLHRLAVAGIYGKEVEVRGQMLRRALEACDAEAKPAQAPEAAIPLDSDGGLPARTR